MSMTDETEEEGLEGDVVPPGLEDDDSLDIEDEDEDDFDEEDEDDVLSANGFRKVDELGLEEEDPSAFI